MRHAEIAFAGIALIEIASAKARFVVDPATIIGVVASTGLGTIVGATILATSIVFPRTSAQLR